MKTHTIDVAVVGAGTAGLVARRAAEKLGARVVLIEGGPYGTTCARVGCMPSKLLIAAADAAWHVADAGTFGIRVPPGVRVDGRAVLERVRRERDHFVAFVLDSVEAIPAEQRLRGCARFVGPTSLQVDDHTRVDAKAVVIATGASPSVPTALRPFADMLLSSENIFELPDLPSSLAIIGAGIIGLEIGQALHRLGVRTTWFSRSDRLTRLSDPAVRAVVARVFGAELDLQLQTDPTITRAADGFQIRWTDGAGAAREARFEAVLCATGRHPNLDALDLPRAGIRGLPAIDPQTMQAGNLPIFVAGDVTAYRPLLHEAVDEGRIAGGNAARYPEVRAHSRRTPLEIVFTSPNIAVVGARHCELDPAETAIGEVSYADQGRARVMNENAGIVRIYARKDCGALVGAEMFGPRVEHTAHLLAWAIQSGLTAEDALELPVYHPVIEEGIRSALRDLCTQLKLRPPEQPRDLECGPGA
jgi:dihydrolipoamide dehydrogenase